MKFLIQLSVLIVFMTIASFTKSAAQIPWTQFDVPAGNIKANMPGPFTMDTTGLNGIFSTGVKLINVRSAIKGVVCTISWADAPDSIRTEDVPGILLKLRDQIATTSGGTPDRERDMFLGTVRPYPGREFSITVPVKKVPKPKASGRKGKKPNADAGTQTGNPGFRGGSCRCRVYVVNNRVYQVMICMSSYSGEDMDAFYDGFDLLKVD